MKFRRNQNVPSVPLTTKFTFGRDWVVVVMRQTDDETDYDSPEIGQIDMNVHEARVLAAALTAFADLAEGRK